jgi:hypothetical protein
MEAEMSLAAVRDDARQRVPNPPEPEHVIEDAGRQRLAAYYLYSALLAGVLEGDDLAPGRWPPRVAEPMQRLGLTRLAPRTRPGLEAQLTPAELDSLRSHDTQSEFAQLVVDLINQGAFGSLCGDADSVRLAAPGDGQGRGLELIKDGRLVGTCKVTDHWELLAQHLAGAPVLTEEAQAQTSPTAAQRVGRQLRETGISHAVSLSADIAVNIHPLGAAVGLGTRLVRARLRADREAAGTLRDLGQDLATLRDQADHELADVRAERSAGRTTRRPGDP